MAVGLLGIPPPLWERDHVVTRLVAYCVVSPLAPLNTILLVMSCAMSMLFSLKKIV